MPRTTPAARNARSARRSATSVVTTAPAKTKALKVILKVTGETLRMYKFTYSGTSKTPLVKSLYVTKEAIEMANDKPLTIGFTPYVPTGNQAAMPKSAIRYSGDADTVPTLYVDRAQGVKAGLSNDSTLKVVLTITDEEHIELSITAS